MAKRTRIDADSILEIVRLSDLSRLGAVKSVRARLYLDAGFDTPHRLATWDPEELRQMLIEFVKRTGFDGIAPLPKELRNTVATAKKLAKVVQY